MHEINVNTGSLVKREVGMPESAIGNAGCWGHGSPRTSSQVGHRGEDPHRQKEPLWPPLQSGSGLLSFMATRWQIYIV